MEKKLVKQIPLDFHDLDEIAKLVSVLKKSNYSIKHGLEDPFSCGKIVAIVVDTEEKTLTQTNVTCMSCWSKGKRRPLYASEIIENFEELIIKRNLKLYEQLLKKAQKDKNRPIGQIMKIK